MSQQTWVDLLQGAALVFLALGFLLHKRDGHGR